MLSKSRRLSVNEFNSVVEKGRITSSSFFLLRSLRVEGITKIATAVPKKVSKTAVGRNRLRRRMYGAVRHLYPVISGGYHVIVFAKNTAIDSDSSVLSKELKDVFVKAGILK